MIQKEKCMIECIESLGEMYYAKTQDKFWLRLAQQAREKLSKEKRKVDKWWLKR